MIQKWKQHLQTVQQGGHVRTVLESISTIERDEEYSDFFKFLTATVKIKPQSLAIVVERIQLEWQNINTSREITRKTRMCVFKSTVSFLGRLKKSLRRGEGMCEIAKLWPLIFNFPGENRLKLLLVREYRRDLPFHWLLDFVLRDEFFYTENLNVEELDCGGVAVIEILVELLEKARRDGNDNEFCDELRVSGLLEKIGSLWRSPSLKKLLKLLALASSISNNIFDSLPALLTELTALQADKSIWRLRLVDSILKKYPKKQYVLSQIRAELTGISAQVVGICGESLENVFVADDDDDDLEMSKAICSLLKSVLERWEDLACVAEVESAFFDIVRGFLERAYKENIEKDFGFKILYVFSRTFVTSLQDQDLLVLFFRNSVKYVNIDVSDNEDKMIRWMALNSFTRLMVVDGGTDLGFLKLFRQYPSLISDIYSLIQSIDANETSVQWEWILLLAESPRTKNVLIDFLIDPKQINNLVCDSFWLAFIGKLVTEENFERIAGWMGGNLTLEFFERAKRSYEKSGENKCWEYYSLMKIMLSHSVNISSPSFVLGSCKGNAEMFDWILANKIADAEMVYDHLTELVPFGNVQIARRVHELIKSRIRKSDELVDCLLQPIPDRIALAEWNLLVESGTISYAADAEIQNLFSKDYGKYLEQLFELVGAKDNLVLVKESSDPIEMYLEYYKYGQIRAMTLLQEDLLRDNEMSELLLRIPLPVLRASGLGFGGVILDHFLVNGWTERDMWIIEQYSRSVDLSVLKLYYKNRINKQ